MEADKLCDMMSVMLVVRFGIKNDAAKPTSQDTADIAVIVVRWLAGNHSIDNLVGATIKKGRAIELRIWPPFKHILTFYDKRINEQCRSQVQNTQAKYSAGNTNVPQKLV